MDARCSAIAITMAKVSKRHGKRYGFPSQRRLLELLSQCHGYEISERTLRRDLREMESEHFIKTTHRTRRDKTGKRFYTSNLYKLSKKFFIWLESLEKLATGLFSHFHRPKMADYQLLKKRASLPQARASVEILWIPDSKGTPVAFNAETGIPIG